MSKRFYLSENAGKFCKDNGILTTIQSIDPSSLSFYNDENAETMLAECDTTILKKTLRDIMSEVCGWPKAKVIDEYLIDAILEKTPVCLVTDDDMDKTYNCAEGVEGLIELTKRKREWKVDKGYFEFGEGKYKSTIEVPESDSPTYEPEPTSDFSTNDIETASSPSANNTLIEIVDKLGCYCLDGIIFLFIDKIYETCKDENLAELNEILHYDASPNFFWALLHKVMLHEYIHAFFHIDETLNKIDNKWIMPKEGLDEESLDNALLIYTYVQGASADLLRYTMWFISQQPKNYKASLKFLGIEWDYKMNQTDFLHWLDDNRIKLVQHIQDMIAH